MMTGGDMSSIVQKIARQALITFKSSGRIDGASKSFLENQSKLKSLMTEVRATDLKLVPGSADSPTVAQQCFHAAPPVTYMHICETDEFSMGVFLLKTGASIPLHDHPGMHGMLKVMYGKVKITCFDRLDKSHSGATTGDNSPPFQKGVMRLSVLRSTREITEESGPCILAPNLDNIHQIDAVDGPMAFLDVLAPPYDPDDGRDCHYYKVLPPELTQTGDTQTEPSLEQNKMVSLMEISQPPDFWCGAEPYPGPEVCL